MATELPEWDVDGTCPRCQYEVEEATAVDPDDPLKYPAPFDATICARCGLVMVYVDSGDGKVLNVRQPNLMEWAWFLSQDEFVSAISWFHGVIMKDHKYQDAFGTEWVDAGPRTEVPSADPS
jgi:hypothetical protein